MTFALTALVLMGSQVPSGAGSGAGSSTITELPDIVEIASEWASGHGLNGIAGFASDWKGSFFALGSAVLLAVLGLTAASRREMVPGRMQNAAEFIVEKARGFLEEMLGRYADEHLPFLGTLFLYILLMNLSGLVPLLKAPTSMLETTAGLAIVAFVYVQINGIRYLGPAGYLHHIAGSPESPADWMMLPLMLPIHLVSELARPLSLAIRLFGNIMGEDTLIAVFTGLGAALLASLFPVGIPFALPLVLLAILLSTVQALVFTLLTTLYIAQVLPEEHSNRLEAA
jgi:F-type H+-transporting ATPase subunit a